MIFLEEQTILYIHKFVKPKYYARSYIDVVRKPPSRNFVDVSDIHVYDENVTNDK